MDVLKKILRQALQDQAIRVKLQIGQPVEYLTDQGANQRPADANVDDAFLQSLYAFLFPNDKAAIATKQTTKGLLAIPNVGKILLIAQPASPASLRLYMPPKGNQLFDSDWMRLNNKTVTPDGAFPMPPPDAPLFGGGARQTVVNAGSPSGGTQAPPSPVQAPAGAHSAGATGVAEMPGMFGGFVPPEMPSSPPPPSGGLDPGFDPLPDLTGAGPIGFPMPPPPMLGGGVPVAAPLPPPRQNAVAAPTPALEYLPPPSYSAIPGPGDAAASESVELMSGPDIGGMAAVSEGNNPIDPVLRELVAKKGSDAHITCGEVLCFRIDGSIERVGDKPLTPELLAKWLLPIMPKRNIEELAKTNDTDFAYEIRGLSRFRCNMYRDRNGLGAVIRTIPTKILTSEQLGLPPAITKFCALNKGLVVVTGPTGSGKSTTLAAMIDLINKTRDDHIITIEDPIEFVHPQQNCLVNQREIHKHTTSFSRALRAALREDPDIVLVGEMRDLETVAIGIETAETGHLVFGTLHTNTAVSTIDRIIDQFPTDRQSQIRVMLASSLKGVVAQTLLKKKGGGRVAAHEILVVSDPVASMIREGKNHMIGNHMQTQKADGNVMLNESLTRLSKEGLVDPDEAMRKSVDKNALLEMFKRHGVKWEPAVPPATAPAQGHAPAPQQPHGQQKPTPKAG